jgi:hypothetical protein
VTPYSDSFNTYMYLFHQDSAAAKGMYFTSRKISGCLQRILAEELAALLMGISSSLRQLSLGIASTAASPNAPTITAPTDTPPTYVEGATGVGAPVPDTPAAVPAAPTVANTIIASELTERLIYLGIYTPAMTPGIAPGTAAELPPYVEPPADETARLMSSSIPPEDRWYVVTRGFKPGVYQSW